MYNSVKSFILFFILIFTVNLTVLIPSVGQQESVHPLLPFTSQEDIVPCSDYIDLEFEYETSRTCSAKSLKVDKDSLVKVPECYIVLNTSPDVHSDLEMNYIKELGFFGAAILGFYDIEKEIMFLVNNERVAEIFRHEMQHHYLNGLGITEGDHDHPSIWKDCESARYDSSLSTSINPDFDPKRKSWIYRVIDKILK